MKGLQSLPGLLNLELTDRSWAIRGVAVQRESKSCSGEGRFNDSEIDGE